MVVLKIMYVHVVFLCVMFVNTYAQEQALVRFGILADIQYADIESKGSRFYRHSLAKLDTAISILNAQQLAFVVNLGDIIDRDYKSFDDVIPILNKNRHKLYNTTGNHDYSGTRVNSKLYKRLGMPSAYYQFYSNGWRFIMLNTNEIASYANIENTWKEKELNSLRQISIRQGRKNEKEYNGGISSKQMIWLEKILKKAQSRKEKVIVLAHHPLAFAEGYTALNDVEIQQLIKKYTCVKAVFSGHHHPGDFGIVEDVPYTTVEGMVETSSQNAYGIVEIFADKIKVIGYGRMTTRQLKMRE